MKKEKIRQFITTHKKWLVCVTIIFVTLSILIYCNLPSTVMRGRFNAFHDLCAFYETYGPQDRFYFNDYPDSVYSQHRKLLKKCGLGTGDLEEIKYVMDEEFVDAYINKYSVEEFIEKLFYINSNIDADECNDSLRWPDEHCYSRTMNKVLPYALKCAGISMQRFSLPQEGTEGYYTENPDEIPEEEKWEEKGEFYSSSGTNRRTETVPCSKTVTVHGDFAVIHCDIYYYSKGEYGWRNGKFYDELPSWDHRVYDLIEYKGHETQKLDSLLRANVFSIGGNYYVLYPSEDCGYSDSHTSRVWGRLG